MSPQKKWLLRHPGRQKQIKRASYLKIGKNSESLRFKELQKDTRKYLRKAAQSRARMSGLEFNLSVEDIVLPEVCPILLIPLCVNKGGSAKANSPSLDRIDNTKGYTKDNICVISHRANSNKGSMTIEQVSRLLAYMQGSL